MKTTKLMLMIIMTLASLPAFARHQGDGPEPRTRMQMTESLATAPSQPQELKEDRAPCGLQTQKVDEAPKSQGDSGSIERKRPFHHVGRSES